MWCLLLAMLWESWPFATPRNEQYVKVMNQILNTKSANPLLSNLPPPSHQVGALGPRTHLDDGPYVALHRLHGCLELGRGLHLVEDVGCFLLEDGAEVVL